MLNQFVLVGKFKKVCVVENSLNAILFIDVERPTACKESDEEVELFSICIPWKDAVNYLKNCTEQQVIGLRGRIQIKKVEVQQASLFVTELIAEKISFLSD